MRRVRLKLAVLACAGLGLAACEGSTISAPESPRYACQWAREGGGCDPVDNTKYVVHEGRSVFDLQLVGNPNVDRFDRVDGRSWTTAWEGAASVTVTAELRHDKYCDGSYNWLNTLTKTEPVSSHPTSAVVYFTNQQDPLVKNRWRISGTHTATAAAGYVGGGPLYSSVTSSCL
ncbi:MAG TPA: hypothetical protein VHG51_01475 [Longimicrobiaceae bacterium]|nr:hypothetical protein [Longimicrobiaceae bacterium]